ncbi:TRCF domain-containing protein [Rhodoligotrophos defluvii]|uniref:TRCF domain-containing protein n=1 Tax=Rhodoligotrophos defluvii TaxID=2561934 RepID=UPI001485BE82|nr:TRCF domain-containing protein [Rhodoligotrophos defluvii]
MFILAAWHRADPGGVLVLSVDERRAERLGAVLHALDATCEPLVLPRWDVLPYDGALPSRTVTGRRASVLRRLADNIDKPLVLASADAALQRVPPRHAWAGASLAVRLGDRIADDQLRTFFERAGYVVDVLVDEPGEVAIQGQMLDVFPAGALGPVRIGHQGGRITSIQSYDPATQRTGGDLDAVVLDPASELFVLRNSQASDAAPMGASLFDYLPRSALIRDGKIDQRAAAWLRQVREARESERELTALRRASPASPGLPEITFLDEEEWHAALAERPLLGLGDAEPEGESSVPKFMAQSAPGHALRAFIEDQLGQGRRVVLTAANERDLKRVERRIGQLAGVPIARLASWHDVLASEVPRLVSIQVDFDAGFVLSSQRIAVIAAADILGSRAEHEAPLGWRDRELGAADDVLRPGDMVIHLERGAAVLEGLDTITTPALARQDLVRLSFADDTAVMLPVEELALIWKYGADADIKLDRADGRSWARRHATLVAEIEGAARNLIALARERKARSAPRLRPPVAEYERFVARFPHFPTPDQAQAAEDVLADLVSGSPMDRLVCGDVGFGKTEVALRAAAAAVLSGKQVAVAVPTTVLARQHVETFGRRFAGFGIEIGHLSRFVPAAEQRRVKKGLANGSVRLVIGTHALAQKGISFKELGLLVIDEEQRFGARQKAKLRALAGDAHVLTLTATPIPRTMQLAGAGLRSVSVIATPPARRLPVRTVAAALDDEAVRSALLYEWRRGGQSFVVCPRVEDIDQWQERLARLVPELRVVTLHGKLPGAEIDEIMMRFAGGEADVLLATNIIESGLDLPRANTMLVWRPERFGLAQLHQLRGRVGRAARRGYFYLLADPNTQRSAAARKRLQTLQEVSGLGGGFEISARDLDLRGAGALFGEAQAGHLKLVGPGLYRHLLQRAVQMANGEQVSDDYVPEVNLEASGRIPEDYVADEAVRLELYGRLAKLPDEASIEAFSEEMEDRFGPPPLEAKHLLASARIRQACRQAGITKINAGPRAIALTFQQEAGAAEAVGRLEAHGLPCRLRNTRLVARLASPAEERVDLVLQVVGFFA